MADESERPGTCKSNVGVEAMDEPWTKRIVPSRPGEVPARFSQRKRLTSPLVVQCSCPAMLGSAAISGSFPSARRSPSSVTFHRSSEEHGARATVEPHVHALADGESLTGAGLHAHAGAVEQRDVAVGEVAEVRRLGDLAGKAF